jgi:hypothetical protein
MLPVDRREELGLQRQVETSNHKSRIEMKTHILLTVLTTFASVLTLEGAEVRITTDARLTHSCGWMASNSTVGSAFQGYWLDGHYYSGAPEGTVVYTWNESTQDWNMSTYEFGEWNNSSLALTRVLGDF